MDESTSFLLVINNVSSVLDRVCSSSNPWSQFKWKVILFSLFLIFFELDALILFLFILFGFFNSDHLWFLLKLNIFGMAFINFAFLLSFYVLFLDFIFTYSYTMIIDKSLILWSMKFSFWVYQYHRYRENNILAFE